MINVYSWPTPNGHKVHIMLEECGLRLGRDWQVFPINIGAGDQGLMFGYACDETPELMPAPIYYAHRLVERQAQLRKDGRLPFLRPDAKSQVTMRYVDGKPHSIDTVVLSTQHSPDQSESATKMKASFTEAIIEEIIKPLLPAECQGGGYPLAENAL